MEIKRSNWSEAIAKCKAVSSKTAKTHFTFYKTKYASPWYFFGQPRPKEEPTNHVKARPFLGFFLGPLGRQGAPWKQKVTKVTYICRSPKKR
jgi:hypothetical protein